MNLHNIAGPIVGAINPPLVGWVVANMGYTTNAAGKRTETTITYKNVPMQVQPLTQSEIDHLDSLNIQGIRRAVYLNGNLQGLNRVAGKGGDVLMIPTRMTAAAMDTWLCVAVLERWDTDGWCKVAMTLQNVPQDQ